MLSESYSFTLLLFQETQALHYELNKTIAQQRRVALRQAELLEDQKEKITELEQKLQENQGLTPAPSSSSMFLTLFAYMCE